MSRWVALGIALLLSGCGFWGGATSLEAAVRDVAARGWQPAEGEPAIKLIRPIEGGAAVVFTHESVENGQRAKWTSLHLFQHRLGGWFPVSGGGGGAPDWMPEQPVEYASGSGGTAEQQYVYVYGLVNDPAVTQVAVTFPDGARDVTLVENGAYLILRPVAALQARPGEIFSTRTDAGGGARIEALDAQGNVLHTNQP